MSKKIVDQHIAEMPVTPRKSRGYAAKAADCAAGVPGLHDLAHRSDEADTVESPAFNPTADDLRRVANGGEP